jgi:hypothetical protein
MLVGVRPSVTGDHHDQPQDDIDGSAGRGRRSAGDTGRPRTGRHEPNTVYAFAFPALDGGAISLADYTGRPLMIVNAASLCGYTPQYAGLQELWTEFHGRGLTIIGVPSNDFGGQEPGGSSEIAATAQHSLGALRKRREW